MLVIGLSVKWFGRGCPVRTSPVRSWPKPSNTVEAATRTVIARVAWWW